MGAEVGYVESTFHTRRSYIVSYLTDEPPDTLEQMNHSIRLSEKMSLAP